MRYYPVLLDVKSKVCCVVGGGAVALRKTQVLCRAGASVRVVAPEVCKGLARLIGARKADWVRGRYSAGALKDAWLVISATDDERVNARVSADAARRRMFSNIVDVPSLSGFIVPAVAEKNGIMVAVSTSGRAPALSRRIRLDLERDFLPSYAGAVRIIRSVRAELLKTSADARTRRSIMTRLCRAAGMRSGVCLRGGAQKLLASIRSGRL